MRCFISKKNESAESSKIFHRHLPIETRDDDIYLVSFPKSGNTWISFILANVMVSHLDLGLVVNHFNIHGFVPDIHQGRRIPRDLGFFPFKRVIKSHHPFNNDYKNIIYLVRDPRSVMVSYHNYLVGLGQYSGTLRELIRSRDHGVLAWKSHLDGWLDGIKPGARFRIFRYEDFYHDPRRATQNLAALLGAMLRPDQLDCITTACAFQTMQALESSTGTLASLRHNPQFRFVRQGKTTGWQEILDDEDHEFIKHIAGERMAQFSYT